MRTARKRSETGYYHVVNRGNNRQAIFGDDADRLKFLDLLDCGRREFGLRIIAWCLMGNHVHLLLDDAEGRLSAFMHKVLGGYAFYLNARRGRGGHLFQGRFFSDPVESDERLLECVRYILNNPAYAGICPAGAYRWSSYAEYAGEREPSLTDTSTVLDLLGSAELLTRFIADRDRCIYAFEGGRYLPDDEARRLAVAVSERFGTTLDKVHALRAPARGEVIRALSAGGLSYKQIGRLCGISSSAVGRADSHGHCTTLR